MKIIKIIYDSIPRILIAISVIWLFFNYGLAIAVIAALIPVASQIIRKDTHKARRLSTQEFINEIDESGEHHE